MKSVFLIPLAVALLLASGTLTARPDKVELELEAMAKDIAKVLAKQDQKAVRIGRFVGGGDLPTNFGPNIQQILIREFTKLQVACDPRALLEVTGSYRPSDEDPAAPDQKLTFIRINAQLVNTKTGLPLNSVAITSRAVYGNEELTRYLAVTSSLPPAGDLRARNAEIKKKIEKPDADVNAGRIRTNDKSPFTVEILVVDQKDAPDPDAGRPAVKDNGLPFVPIKRGEYYRVKITNNAPFEVAVKLSVDGLDQYTFSNPDFRDPKTGSPKYSVRFIGKGDSAVIGGWFRDLKSFDYFVVTEYAKSASAELKASPDEVGQIVVQFHASWDKEKEEEKPADERGRDGGDATGRDPGGMQNLKEKSRVVGVLRETVAIRYTRK
jgi:hypothetical protein